MNWLIDGYNLGFKDTDISPWINRGDTDRAIRILVQKVDQILGKNQQAILVLDGRKGYYKGHYGTVNTSVIFSKKPETADDIIRRKIRQERNPQDWTVVSSDHEIQNTARDMGANVMKSEAFITLRDIHTKKDKPNEPGEKYNPESTDVDYWLKIFGE